MEAASIIRLFVACGVIALVLAVLRLILQAAARHKAPFGCRAKLVSVLETTVLSTGAALHVIRIAGRYALVASCSTAVTLLADIPSSQIDDGERLSALRRKA